MAIVVKAFFALSIGLGMIAGVQALGLLSVKQYLASDAAKRPVMPAVKPAYTWDSNKIGSTVIPKMPPIDTSAGQRAAINSIQRQIDLQIRAAQNSVPVPKKYPGMR